MKFSLGSIKDIEELVKKLTHGLTKLTLADNMETFETTFSVAGGKTITIRNKLTSTPTRYIIVAQEGNGLLTKTTLQDGKETIQWNNENVYIKNNGKETVKATVVFMR
tara:strand:+ start:666 stop:989 length:324 start_codon:yes stop_codon:yes gene_type:complete